MRSLSLVLTALLSLLLLTEVVLASPVLFDKLFAAYQPTYSGGYGGNQYGYYYGSGGGGSSPTHKRKPKGRSYKDICRVVNPTPYALPGSVPYPAAPFCPY